MSVDNSKRDIWAKMQADARSRKGGGGSGSTPGSGGPTSGGMDIVDAKISAAESRTDVKFERVISKLEHIDKSTSGLRLNTWLAAATALGLAVAALAYGAGQFGNGVMVTSASVQDAAEAKRIAVENAAEVRALREDLGRFIQTFQPTEPR